MTFSLIYVIQSVLLNLQYSLCRCEYPFTFGPLRSPPFIPVTARLLASPQVLSQSRISLLTSPVSSCEATLCPPTSALPDRRRAADFASVRFSLVVRTFMLLLHAGMETSLHPLFHFIFIKFSFLLSVDLSIFLAALLITTVCGLMVYNIQFNSLQFTFK